jgi:cell division protein FtsQ
VADGTAHRRRVVAVAVTVLVVVVAIGWALTFTSLFAARHIRVKGNVRLTDQQVRDLGQVSAVTNVAHLEEQAVVDRLLADPWIATADVRTEWPSTLVLTIGERRVVGVIDAMGERVLLATDGGELPMPDPPLTDLPTVRAGLGAPDELQRLAAADLLSALPPTVSVRVSDVLVGQDGVITMRLTDGVSIDAGTAGRERDKAEAIDAILRWAHERNLGLSAIDVSSPAAPAVTLSDGSTVVP